LTFPAALRESARKALIIQGSALDIEKISRYFPGGRENRDALRTRLATGPAVAAIPTQETIDRFGVAQ